MRVETMEDLAAFCEDKELQANSPHWLAGEAPAVQNSMDRMSKTQKKSSTKSRRSRGGGEKRDRRWSAKVTKRSDALDLERSVFKSEDPHKIALSLKRSAQTSKRRKGTPYQSAMSMLNFYINRAGKNLPKKRKRLLERAKDELRDVFGRK